MHRCTMRRSIPCTLVLLAAFSSGRVFGDAMPGLGVGAPTTSRTVGGLCREGQQYHVPVIHEHEANAVILDAELRANAYTGSSDLVSWPIHLLHRIPLA